MFFKKRKEEYLSKISSMEEGVSAALAEQHTMLQHGNEALAELKKQTGVHDAVLEDLSDTLAELRDQESETVSALKRELDELRAHDREEGCRRENALLELLMQYRVQMDNVETLLSEEEGWKRQFALIRKQLDSAGMKAGVTVLGDAGAPVDYTLHEVMDVQDTAEADLDGCIAQVYEAGFAYRGRIRKARVSAYRFRKPEHHTGADNTDTAP